MGRKKRTKQSPPVVPGNADVTSALKNVTEQNPNSCFANKQLEKQPGVKKVGPSVAIKLECEKALNALRRGNHTRALNLIKDLCGRNLTCVDLGFVHRFRGTVCFKVASILDDVSKKDKFVRNAIESAKKATLLSPNSVEYAHFYANLLFEVAEGAKEYSEVLEECERALGIENPVDPGAECLQEESQSKMLSGNERISLVQNELRGLMQRANFGSISALVNNLGNGENKIHIIPMRKPVEDPMDMGGLVQAKKCNEIKKANKTLEERRKEIEVRVAAARLLQQNSESLVVQDDSDKVSDQSSSPGQRIRERKKGGGNVKKIASSAEWKDFVQSYWNSLTSEMKINLLSINLSDVEAHFSLSKDARAYEVLLEAILFAEVKKQWNFWACCSCNQIFTDSESHLTHVLQEHTSKPSPEMQSVLPQNVNDEWIDMLLTCCWKSLDVFATVGMLKKQSNSVDPNSTYQHRRNDIDEHTYLWDSAPQDIEIADRFENEVHGNISESIWEEYKENAGCKTTFGPVSWPLSDDVECAKLLQKISSEIQLLIKHKCLTGSHLNKIIKFATSELQKLDSVSELLTYGVDQTPLCICFLRAQELKKVLDFLQELSHSCGVGWHSEKTNIQADTNQKVVLDELNLFLLFDENFMPCKVFPSTCQDAVTDDATSTLSESVAHKNGALDANALLSWIYTGSASTDQLTYWMLRERKVNEGMEILQNYEKEFQQLQTLCARKIGHFAYEEALQSIADICIEEGKRRDHATGLLYQSYVSVLRKRQQELTKRENDDASMGSKFELTIILNILKQAESLHASELKLEDIIGGGGSDVSVIVFGDEDNRKMKKFWRQIDSWIVDDIQRQKEVASDEVNMTFQFCVRFISRDSSLSHFLIIAAQQN